MIFWLRGAPEECWFPDPAGALGEPNGLLAAGGDLSPERLLEAYRRGIFPWYEAGQPILWWSPDPRAVLWPEDLHVSRRLARRLRSDAFRVSLDQDFEAVIRGCGDRGPDVGTWITPAMERAYARLHILGHAHSVEVWQDGALAGGLYGVAMGRVFFAESMFSAVTDASKVALACLTRLLQRHGFRLIDCQMATPHLTRLGCREIPRSEFLEYIDRWCREPAETVGWQRPPMHPLRYIQGADPG